MNALTLILAFANLVALLLVLRAVNSVSWHQRESRRFLEALTDRVRWNERIREKQFPGGRVSPCENQQTNKRIQS